MKEFDIFKYEVDKDLGFPVIITFYYRYNGEKIGFIEIYRTGICYTDLFGSGIHIKYITKMLRIANKERVKRKIKTFIKRKLFKK